MGLFDNYFDEESAKDIEGFQEIFRQREQEQHQETEFERDPHYVVYEEELKRDVFVNLSKLAGLSRDYEAPGRRYEASPDKFVNVLWIGEDVILQPIVTEIVNQGLKDRSLTYLDREILVITQKIQGSQHYKGRLLPFDEDDASGFWDEDYVGTNEVLWIAAQRVEVERMFLAWLHRLWKRIFVEPLQAMESTLGNKVSDLKSPEPQSHSFSDFLSKDGLYVLPFLESMFKGAKALEIAIMIYAMEGLNLLRQSISSTNQTTLHAGLENTFGNIGTRASLNSNIKNKTSNNLWYAHEIKKLQEELLKKLALKRPN